MVEQKQAMALPEVLRELEETHRRLLDYLHSVPEEHFRRETPFRHRLRLDTYSHYPLHARAIQQWRGGAVGERGGGEEGGGGRRPLFSPFFGGKNPGFP